MALKRITKELKDFRADNKGLKDLLHGGPLHDGPQNSPYKDGKYVLDIHFPQDYPFKPPKVTFITKIYNPCINNSGAICTGCVDILKDNWSPALTISKLLFAIYCLLQTEGHCTVGDVEYDYTCTVGGVECSKLCRKNYKQFSINAIEHAHKYA
eukprot:70372_1